MKFISGFRDRLGLTRLTLAKRTVKPDCSTSTSAGANQTATGGLNGDRPSETTKEQAATYYAPETGCGWNPLVKHRNLKCPCDSGLKVKKCCGQMRAIPNDVADQVKGFLEFKGIK